MLSARAGLFPATAGTGLTPEFLTPPPRPLVRYPTRPIARRREEDEPHLPIYQQQPYRFLPQASYPPFLYPRVPFSPLRARSSGFVPPSPREQPRTPATPEQIPHNDSAARAPHFKRGALIRLENGSLRRVEDMRTEDFASSAESRSDVCLTHCTLLKMEEKGANVALTLAYDQNRSKVELESTAERPFFVYGQGWASCSPERTLACYGLSVRPLRVGDVCVSLMAQPTQIAPENLSLREDEARKRRWSASDEGPPRKR